MINAVIFDLDGIIIDSEPLWKVVEKKVFATVGVMLTTELCMQTLGLDCRDTIKYWYARKPWTGKDTDQLYNEIIRGMYDMILEKVELKEGFTEALDMIKRKSLPLAVASSSPQILIRAALDKFRITDIFSLVYSSETEPYGKPHPGVYLSTARELNIIPQECLAIEDSFNGSIAAKAARMKLVTVPDPADFNNRRFDFCDLKLSSLRNLSESHFEMLNSL